MAVSHSRLFISAWASFDTEPSGPGLPAFCAARARCAVSRSSSCSIQHRVSRSRSSASCAAEIEPFARSSQSFFTCAMAPPPFRFEPPPPMATRSFISVVIATRQPWPSSPSMCSCGMRTSLRKTSLNSASPVIW